MFQINNLAIAHSTNDGLSTYINTLKWKHFLNNGDEDFSNIEAINFDIIQQQCRGIPL